MADAPDVPEVRPPTLDDVQRICRALQRAEARDVLIGGFAVATRIPSRHRQSALS